MSELNDEIDNEIKKIEASTSQPLIVDTKSLQTFVYDGREWLLTSRKAAKQVGKDKIKVLYEIMPLNIYTTSPQNKNYNRWLPKSDLFPLISDVELDNLYTKGFKEQP